MQCTLIVYITEKLITYVRLLIQEKLPSFIIKVIINMFTDWCLEV